MKDDHPPQARTTLMGSWPKETMREKWWCCSEPLSFVVFVKKQKITTTVSFFAVGLMIHWNHVFIREEKRREADLIYACQVRGKVVWIEESDRKMAHHPQLDVWGGLNSKESLFIQLHTCVASSYRAPAKHQQFHLTNAINFNCIGLAWLLFFPLIPLNYTSAYI